MEQGNSEERSRIIFKLEAALLVSSSSTAVWSNSDRK